MTRTIRNGFAAFLIAAVTLMAFVLPAGAAGGWSAPVRLSTPIPPTDVVGGPTIAVTSTGSQAAAWYDQAADGSQFVHVRTSADGRTWSAPTTLGGGVSPAVALAPDGRAVAVWEGLPPISGVMKASVRPPGGTWSTPVTLGTDAGAPQLAIDGAGNAVAVWASNAGVLTASLPAGGSWSPVRTLDPSGRAVRLAVNSGGSAVAAWNGPTGAIFAAAGTTTGGFSAAVTVAPPAYRQGNPAIALNGAGQASLVWRGRTTVLAATRTAGGAWSSVTTLTTGASGSVSTAIDGAGNAVAAFVRVGPGATTFPVYVSRLPAGGPWGSATLISSANDHVGAPQAAAAPAGAFVVAWTDGNGNTLRAATAAPGGSFGSPAAVASAFGSFDLAAAPGHAVLMWTSGGATVSGESL